jgi:predicted small secreted protein
MKFKILIFNIILGISIGLVISSYFIRNTIYHGPNSLDVQKKIFKDNNNCFKLVPNIIKCPYNNYHN